MKSVTMKTWEVQAILDNRKMVFRRVVKPQPHCYGPNIAYPKHESNFDLDKNTGNLRCSVCGHFPQYSLEGKETCYFWKPPYHPGDTLHIKETWAPFYETMRSIPVIGYRYYAETDEEIKKRLPGYLSWFWPGKWSAPVTMPREAARLFLRVTDVRVERLQSMTEADAVAEGFEAIKCDCPCGRPCTDCMDTGYLEPAMLGFVETWNSTIKPADRARYGWEASPWVWVVEFERISKGE